ncbi:MAG: sigma-54 dependent transcriptional regulator [Desulfuromonadaceae bacterium]|nr:sigma-54 dependent transcriptional regulator [Desulfuromonadaceae bacterium]MDD2855428.1 sigma-54 dependent transcriptional regulator [Desulfuromonadaceae bacterium]
MQQSILIIDDEKDIRTSLAGILEDEGYQVLSEEGGAEGIECALQELPDLILLDIWMPGMDGLETLEKLKRLIPHVTVIMISGHGTIETAVRATKLGAFDFIEKPLSLEKVLISVANALQLQELKVQNAELKRSASADNQLIGTSPKISAVREMIPRIAMTSTPVLISGERGTGKNLIACSLHCSSARRERPFITVNCSAIPEGLIDSELFGHEKGAFAGATSNKKGRFDQADGGTIFLDEIGDLSLSTQAKILNFIRDGRFERVGGNRSLNADIRLVAASSRSLEKDISTGTFSEDLYSQLNTIHLKTPLLRERMEDLDLLVQFFVAQFFRREGGEAKAFLPEALDRLRNYHWPGNLRELKNVVERILIVTQGRVISADDIPLLSIEQQNDSLADQPDAETAHHTALRLAREDFEREFIIQKLEENDWNISRTAEIIELERSNLHRKIKSYGIDVRR